MKTTLVGILGAGQLARMLALAGLPMGLKFRFLTDRTRSIDDDPVADLGECMEGGFSDEETLKRFTDGLAACTVEFENVPATTAQFVANRVAMHPSPAALAVAQNRAAEKSLFQQLDVPTGAHRVVNSLAELQAGVAEFGRPAILKTCRFGYDGKGQRKIVQPEDIEIVWRDLKGSAPLMLEAFVPFEREVSLIAVRTAGGEKAFYPLVHNVHRDGVLQWSTAPAEHADELNTIAGNYGARVLEALQYVGVLAIEFFEVKGGLLANEIAPRVHNSGHWTIEGAETSQFENHLRAVLGWPLGGVRGHGVSLMTNLLGSFPPTHTMRELSQASGVHIHQYGKAEKAGRKIGHLTINAPNRQKLSDAESAVQRLLGDDEKATEPERGRRP